MYETSIASCERLSHRDCERAGDSRGLEDDPARCSGLHASPPLAKTARSDLGCPTANYTGDQHVSAARKSFQMRRSYRDSSPQRPRLGCGEMGSRRRATAVSRARSYREGHACQRDGSVCAALVGACRFRGGMLLQHPPGVAQPKTSEPSVATATVRRPSARCAVTSSTVARIRTLGRGSRRARSRRIVL